MKKSQKIVFGVCAFITIIIGALTFFVTGWVMAAKTKPSFSLQGATVHNFNLTATTAPNFLLTTNITVTIAARIPYKHRGIYYEYLAVYAKYGGHKITVPTPLLVLYYQSYKNVVFWSASLRGISVPLKPHVAVKAGKEMNAGKVSIKIVVQGRIKKIVMGMVVRPSKILHVNCPAYLSFGSTGEYVKQRCRVDVKEPHDRYY